MGSRNSFQRRSIRTDYEPITEIIRLHRKGNVYKSYFPMRLARALRLNGEDHTLIVVCDGPLMVALLDEKLAEYLEPEIQKARQMFHKLKNKVKNRASQRSQNQTFKI